MPKPVIFGCQSLELSNDEKEFFTEHQPFGFIIFARNVDNPEQLKKLTDDLKSCVEHDFIPILVDQEGGRVARLKPPHWTEFPPADTYETEEQVFESAKKLAKELIAVGINTNCAPMLDVRQPDAHDIVGDRAFSEDKEIVASFGKAMAEGMMAEGVYPVIKHIPGHGRAMCDSHEDLPKVCASKEELEIDFAPFKELKDMPFAMTAHIIYEALDSKNCATQSKEVIRIIREEIGFKGMIMTDDLSMKALSGSFTQRTQKSLQAGCDLILHCNGNMEEMKEIAEAIPQLELQAQ